MANQAGRIATEVEPNDNSVSAQSLDSFFAEMTGDSSPRNDRVVLAGRIDSAADVGHGPWSMTATTVPGIGFWPKRAILPPSRWTTDEDDERCESPSRL